MPDDSDGKRDGLSLPFLHQRHVALFAGDCVEQLRSTVPGLPFPLHQVGIVSMGLFLVDSVRADRLVLRRPGPRACSPSLPCRLRAVPDRL